MKVPPAAQLDCYLGIKEILSAKHKQEQGEASTISKLIKQQVLS